MGLEVHTWRRDGIDGIAAQITGRAPQPFRIVVELLDTESLVTAWYSALLALQGKLVTIMNDWEREFRKCLLTRVTLLSLRAQRSPPDLSIPGAHGVVELVGISGAPS